MKKSFLFRRTILLLLMAVLLSGTLSSGIYILVTHWVYADIRAKEFVPIARLIAEIMADRMDGQEEMIMDRQSIKAMLNRENQSFGASLHLYNEHKESILEPPSTSPRIYTDLTEDETLSLIASDLESIFSDSEVTKMRKFSDGQFQLIVGVPIKSGKDIIGAVVFTKSLRELADTRDSLTLTLLISTVISFAIMLIPAYFAARRLLIPIQKMKDIARAMANGNFNMRADESQEGEVGELGRSINHFAREMEHLEQLRRDYVANISHELRTPIASIRAIGETLRDGMAKTEEKKDLFYNNIVHESLRLSQLVDDLLELSRLQSGTEAIQKTQFDLREILKNILDIYGYMAAKAHITFTVTADISQPIPVYSNPDRVEQVLVILLDNAFKHTPVGGEIILANIPVHGKMELSMENTGDGIPEEDLPYLFERFYKVDKSHSGNGTGLGLSIAKEIIKGLGETIRVESAKEKVKFVFTLSLK